MEKALSLDISSDFAIFRRGYTTTSALTYTIPSKPTLLGMFGAILGKDYNDYNTKLKGSKVAVRILNPTKKMVIAQNLISGDDAGNSPTVITVDKGRPRVSFQYLRNPKFRVFFSSEDESFDKLKDMLKDHKTYFTPYLGQARCIADIEYRGEVPVSDSIATPEGAVIHSIIPLDPFSMVDIIFERDKQYGRDILPLVMNADRIVKKSMVFVYETSSKPIRITSGTYQVVSSSGGMENVIFF